MSDSVWIITYIGKLDTVSDAGLTFTRGESQESSDPAIGAYFSGKNSFSVVEVGEAAETKKDLNRNRQNERTSNASEQQSEGVDAVDSIVPVNTQQPATLPTSQDFSNNVVARSQISGYTSDPKALQESQPEVKVSTQKTKKKRESKPPVESSFFSDQLLTDEDLISDKPTPTDDDDDIIV